MKTTENSLLLKANQKQTTITPATDRSPGLRSARPMKSMMSVKSIRPQKVELKGRMRKRVVKL